jgi:hypothetical protein
MRLKTGVMFSNGLQRRAISDGMPTSLLKRLERYRN